MPTKTATTKAKNRVLQEGPRVSQNLFQSDKILQEFLGRQLSKEGRQFMQPRWEKLGQQAAQEMDALSLAADKNGPELVKRNFYGEDINEVRFHPAYERMLEIAVDSYMFRVKWEPGLRRKFKEELHALGFTSGFIYALAELGQYCPLCMTDGVARLIDRFGEQEDKDRLLPHIATDQYQALFTGAMFLTEKAGGSDVGANLVKAEQVEGLTYHMNGEKWFCSNVNAEIIFALARTDEEKPGTRGLSIFMVEKELEDGSRNPMDIIRLKDKLGVRSMASAECMLLNTVGKRVGEEFQGFKVMTEMINLSRLYNSVAALSGARRAIVEAYQFIRQRKSFGKTAIEHPLIREKLWELGSEYVALFYMTWKAIQTLDKADNGDKEAKELVRLLTPMTKKETAEQGVYLVRESMEVMGGIGYIEDGIMPKIMRDMMVLPIWEGAGNIMILDMLRAASKSNGLPIMLSEIAKQVSKSAAMEETFTALKKALPEVMGLDAEEQQIQAKFLFQDLTRLYQMTLLLENQNEENKAWIAPALKYLEEQLSEKSYRKSTLSVEEVEGLMGWDIA